jgi:nucleoid DNA-binding protein
MKNISSKLSNTIELKKNTSKVCLKRSFHDITQILKRQESATLINQFRQFEASNNGFQSGNRHANSSN